MLRKLTIAALFTTVSIAAAPALARDWHHDDHPHHRMCHMGRHHHRICR